MTETILKWLFWIAIFVGNWIIGYIEPIMLPPNVVVLLTDILDHIWSWDGIFPVSALLEATGFTVSVLFIFMIFKVITGLIGSGKPEVD